MKYYQQLQARKNGKYILTTRNFKFIMCGTESEVNAKYKSGNHIEAPLIKKTVTKQDIHAMEKHIEQQKLDGLLV